MDEEETTTNINPESTVQPPVLYYVRPRPPPSQDCEVEKMITIEPISLRKGRLKYSDGILSDLRHIDPRLGTLIFFAILTGILFFLFMRTYKSAISASLYTASAVSSIAAVFSIFGVDLLGAIGGTFAAF